MPISFAREIIDIENDSESSEDETCSYINDVNRSSLSKNKLPQHLVNILENNHFVAAFIPIYFSDTKYPTSLIDYLINKANKEYDLNISCGDWVFTPYNVPHDIAIEGAKEFSFDHIYKLPQIYYNRMNKLKPTSIRYGLPVGEEFIEPIKRQYYGHPALFDLNTKKPFDWSQSKKKHMKKLYEYNQLRLKKIEQSGLTFASYKLN